MKFLLILLRLCVVCVTLIAVVHFQNWRIWSLAENMNPACITTECQKLGKFYKQHMNVDGQPCTDFYDYVCHNWKIHNTRPKELNSEYIWNMDEYLNMKSLEELRKLESKNVSASSDLESAKLLYKTCMDIPFLPRSNGRAVMNNITKIGHFPLLFRTNTSLPCHMPWWEIDRRYIKLTGESALFDFNIKFAPFSRSEILTVLEPLLSAYGSIRRTIKWPGPNQLGHYKTFLKKLITSLAGPDYLISKEVLAAITGVLELRSQMTWCIVSQGRNPKVQPMSVKEFQEWYRKEETHLRNTDEPINWLEEIRAIYKPDDPRSPKIMEFSKVHVPTTYFQCLAGLTGTIDRNVLVNHIHLYFAERHIEFDPQMRAELDASVTDLGSDANGLIRSGPYRWHTCVSNSNVKRLLEKVYSKLFFPKKDKLKVQEIFGKTKELLEQQISESTWLNKEVKNSSIHKLRNIKALIGYPDWYDTNEPAMPNLESISPLDSYAEYNNGLNLMIVSATYLQRPTYTPNAPYVIDYGSTVSLFGHELHHAFDKEGIQYDNQGYTPWWPTTMQIEHAKRSKCFEEQYTKYKVNLVNKLKLPPSYNGSYRNSVDEDMADVLGLKLAYKGFKETLNKSKGSCQVLPGFEKLGCEKLFFIAFANSFCADLKPRQKEAILFEDSHNSPEIRVNGAVANMKEFSIAFGCKLNDPLNLNRTCDFWK